ncbi:MAG TPA: glycosyltransferase family 2 protein [Rhodocyclaceae bacterium]|nr:glycosyltransferase family 2 protein [Rhodocyclaceae bacterium]
MSIKLSICIATFKRGAFIGETLDSILGQMEPGLEIVVVDGASPDDTPEVMARYAAANPEIRYFRESVNSGVDADFDKAVGYAKGEFCWLMTDDDLLCPGAVATVLASLDGENDLMIVNAEVKSVDLSELFEKRRLAFDADKAYRVADREAFFAETAAYLSFIGCVVIRRSCWMARERTAYYGSLFIHVGVIFQNPPIENVRVIAEPQIIIRYGNAMWTSRSFEVWMLKWPGLIWSFPDFTEEAKRKVCRREPWRSAKALFHNRALGAYSSAEFKKFWGGDVGKIERMVAYLLSIFPASLANMVMVAYFASLAQPARMALHDLLFSRNAGILSRLMARVLA